MSAGVTLHELLRDLAREATGFSDTAIAPDALARVAAALAGDAIARCFARDPAVVEAVRKAVVVGETSLFRQRDHFAFVADTVVPRLRARGATAVRAWSAGCACGEEAWSLAATLCASFSEADVDVLGTDLLADHVAAASRALCRTSSLRAPPLFPVVVERDQEDDALVAVRPDVAACARFAVHDLRDAPPVTGFDVIMCRNVLLFFAADEARRVVANLASALAPGGVLVFGPVDLQSQPPGLAAFGPPELCAFERPQPFARAPRSTPPAPAPAPARHAATSSTTDAIALHLRALACVEDGDVDQAARHLANAAHVAQPYVPGLVERALLLDRRGDVAVAREHMRTAAQIVAALDDDDVIVGPEPTPARFWRASIAAFADRHDRQGGDAP